MVLARMFGLLPRILGRRVLLMHSATVVTRSALSALFGFSVSMPQLVLRVSLILVLWASFTSLVLKSTVRSLQTLLSTSQRLSRLSSIR